MNNNFSIAILDDHPIILDGLSTYIENAFPGAKVTTYSRIDLFMSHIKLDVIELLILDLKIQTVQDSIELIKYLKANHKTIKICVFTSFINKSYVNECVDLGVNSYVSKDSSIKNIKLAIEALISDEDYFSKEIECLIDKRNNKERLIRKDDLLSKREMEIVFFLSLGMNSTQISERLHISKNTVRTHRQNILEKTGCTNKFELIQYVQNNYSFD